MSGDLSGELAHDPNVLPAVAVAKARPAAVRPRRLGFQIRPAPSAGTATGLWPSPARSCHALTTQSPAGTSSIAKLPSAAGRAQNGLSRTSTNALIWGWMLQ